MSQPQPNILQLAKQGNPKAIAALINRQLQAKGITAKVSIQDGYLQIILEALEVPNQKILVAFIHKGIMNLEITVIKKAKIYGKCASKDLSSWSQVIEINPQYDAKKNDEKKINESLSNFQLNQAKEKHNDEISTNSINLQKLNVYNSIEKSDKNNNLKNTQQKINTSDKKISIKLAVTIIIISVVAINFLLIVISTKNNEFGAIVDLDGTGKSNELIDAEITQYIREYSPNKNNIKEGILKLTDLAKNYKTSFFTNTSGCSSRSNDWSKNNEENKNQEIQAQIKWELSLVKKQEAQDFLGETDIDDVSSFKNFMSVVSNRIITEKECTSIANSKFPLEPIDYSNNKYTYIIKANQEVEVNYIVFRNSKIFPELVNRPSGISIMYQSVSEAYIKNQIQNISSQKKDIIPELKNGYQICQKLRDIMATSQLGVKLSVNDAAKTMIEENKHFIGADSVNDEQEIITVTVVKLCPQLMK